MKFKVGDQVLVTSGKDKGIKSKIIKVMAQEQKVVVEGANMYVKHIKPYGEKPGERVKRERPMSTAKIAILNDKGKVDRVSYKVMKDGSKQRIFKKTGAVISSNTEGKTK